VDGRTAERDPSERIGLLKETEMPQSNHNPKLAEAGEQVSTTEALRHAAEDTPSGTGPGDVEKTPVFDRAGEAPKI
jgi:hypothetical protein